MHSYCRWMGTEMHASMETTMRCIAAPPAAAADQSPQHQCGGPLLPLTSSSFRLIASLYCPCTSLSSAAEPAPICCATRSSSSAPATMPAEASAGTTHPFGMFRRMSSRTCSSNFREVPAWEQAIWLFYELLHPADSTSSAASPLAKLEAAVSSCRLLTPSSPLLAAAARRSRRRWGRGCRRPAPLESAAAGAG